MSRENTPNALTILEHVVPNVLEVELDSPQQQLSALVQNKVRQVVKARRIARGEEDLQVIFEKPTKYAMTEEEIEKRERRKKQNREAARRCRKKKKLGHTVTQQELDEEQRINRELGNEVARLKGEVSGLQRTLQEHAGSGECLHTSTVSTEDHRSHEALRSSNNQNYFTQIKTEPEYSFWSTYEGDEFYMQPTDEPTTWLPQKTHHVPVPSPEGGLDDSPFLTRFTNISNLVNGNFVVPENPPVENDAQSRSCQAMMGGDVTPGIAGSSLLRMDIDQVTPVVDSVSQSNNVSTSFGLGSLDTLQINQLLNANLNDLNAYIKS